MSGATLETKKSGLQTQRKFCHQTHNVSPVNETNRLERKRKTHSTALNVGEQLAPGGANERAFCKGSDIVTQSKTIGTNICVLRVTVNQNRCN